MSRARRTTRAGARDRWPAQRRRLRAWTRRRSRGTKRWSGQSPGDRLAGRLVRRSARPSICRPANRRVGACHCSSIASSTLSGVIGSRRTRTPVPFATTLPSAAMTGGRTVSPARASTPRRAPRATPPRGARRRRRHVRRTRPRDWPGDGERSPRLVVGADRLGMPVGYLDVRRIDSEQLGGEVTRLHNEVVDGHLHGRTLPPHPPRPVPPRGCRRAPRRRVMTPAAVTSNLP